MGALGRRAAAVARRGRPIPRLSRFLPFLKTCSLLGFRGLLVLVDVSLICPARFCGALGHVAACGSSPQTVL